MKTILNIVLLLLVIALCNISFGQTISFHSKCQTTLIGDKWDEWTEWETIETIMVFSSESIFIIENSFVDSFHINHIGEQSIKDGVVYTAYKCSDRFDEKCLIVVSPSVPTTMVCILYNNFKICYIRNNETEK